MRIFSLSTSLLMLFLGTYRSGIGAEVLWRNAHSPRRWRDRPGLCLAGAFGAIIHSLGKAGGTEVVLQPTRSILLSRCQVC